MGTVKFTIDGHEVTAEAGEMLFDVAENHGIKIPALCHHPVLAPYGACRMCIVEVTKRGRKKITASCSYPVTNGIEVRTDTEEVNRLRRLTVESLLAEAPDAKEIRELAEKLGVKETRFKPNEDSNNRCILCGLCVRICSERMGVEALGYENRGAKRKIATPFGKLSDVCITCGACISVCPTDAIRLAEISKNEPIPLLSDFDMGLSQRHAAYIPFPQAVPLKYVIDSEHCMSIARGKCGACAEMCGPDAIDYSQKQEEIKLDVSSVLVMPGFDQIDPETRSEYGYCIHDNVVTALEFERILSASGPFGGHIKRLSDGVEPKKIAFIQCVGSRDESRGVGYCSAVCCMYAIKEAIIAKEHSPGLEVTIFHMDIRACGKEFEYYYRRAQDLGIKFTRSRVADITEEAGHLRMNFADEAGEPRHELFDLVVLSNGIVPGRDAEELAHVLGIELEEHGFAKTSTFSPLETTRPGVFVSGTFSEPKDIPDTVAQASGATIKAAQYSEPADEEPICVPEKKDVTGEPRIGVLVCHCGINIGNYVDVKNVAEYASSLPNVVYAEDVLYACSQDTQDKIKNLIAEHDLNRVVVASCTPRTHEPLFQETIESAGLNPYLFEMTNIREHCSWVHMDEKEKATEKAKDLVRMTVAKSNLLKPLDRECLSVNSACLVLGGGISGLTAARDLGDAGFNVYLLEREKDLGGNLRHVSALISGEDPKPYLDGLIAEVQAHKNIEVYSSADVKDIQGYVGNFTTTFAQKGKETEITHGAVIVATGGRPYEPEQYMYGKQKNVVTQLDLETMLAKGTFKAGSVVMIQCVGFRDDIHGYCARVCCSQAVKNALRIKTLNPEADIYILYKDMRTYGFLEDYYLSASRQGVRFIRYDDDNKPDVSGGKSLNVTITDPVLGETLVLKPELLVLSSGMEPREDNKSLASMLKVPISKDGFFLEAHMKLRPLDFATDGIFLCGAAHSPKFVSECIAQASGAAARAATILGKQTLMAEGIVSSVDEELCFGCGICVASCPYNAVELHEESAKARVISALCKGCGVCGATCPKHAISLGHFTDSQVLAQIEAFIEGVE